MKLRFVTPTLGQSPWLAETLATAVVPLGQGEQVVVVPGAQCGRLGAAHAGARILPQTGSGLYAALNTGFRAPGEWAAGTWINDDDRLIPAGLAAALDVLAHRPEMAAVFGRVRLIESTGRRLAEIPVSRSGDDLGPLLAAGLIPLAQPGTVFRREVFEQLGGFDESLRAVGDTDFFRRALAAGFRFAFVNAWVGEFRVHRGQISQNVDTRRRETAAQAAAARAVPYWVRRAPGARWRFRWSNLGAYADRVRHHGFVSMERLSARE